MNRLIPMAVVVVCACMGAVAQILFKISLSPLNIIKLGVGFVLYGMASIIYLVALRHLQVSVAYPIISLSYLIVVILSWKFLGEQIGVWQWVGAIGIIVSVGLIVR